jgi:uncharacterized surface protein with fasciclin (FAS1) repeats
MNHPHKYLLGLLLLGCSSLWFSACFKVNSKPATTVTADTGINVQLPLSAILANNQDYSDFDTLLKKSGLYQRVAGGDSAFTLLIPSNEAFAASTISFDSVLHLSGDSLQQFVGYHILAGSIPTASIPQNIDNPYTTLSGQTVYFSKPLYSNIDYSPAEIATGEATLNINGVRTSKTDLAALNGVYIQELAAPLSPPYSSIQAFLSAHAEYSYLVAALRQLNLWNELDSAGPYTFYAPVNSAFLNNGITLDMINSDTFNTSHYQPFLFSAGIVPGRIFTTDFTDAAGLYPPILYTNYGSIQFNNYNNYAPPSLTAYNWVPVPYGFTQIGGNPGYTLMNQPAVNGVINGIDNLLVYPQNVYIGQ